MTPIKPLLILVIIFSVLVSGCEVDFDKKEFCESIGYLDWSWMSHGLSEYNFFCYRIHKDKVITTRIFENRDDAIMYRLEIIYWCECE